MQRLAALALTATAVLSCAPQVDAQPPQPGSVLVFPRHRSATNGAEFSIVTVTNTNPLPSTPISFGGSTAVHFTYMNVGFPFPETPFRAQCVEFNQRPFLTPADTISVTTRCHTAAVPGFDRGYLVVAAQDPAQFNVPWSFNFLVGSMTIVNASGAAYSYDAIPFSSPQPAGSATDLNGNGGLDFDGLEYAQIPDLLIVDQFISGVGANLSLINLTGSRFDENLALLSVWNDMEVALSTTLRFNCWFDAPLTAISPLFSPAFMALLPNDPTELDVDCDNLGDFETGWLIIDSVRVQSPGGVPVASDGAMLGMIQAFQAFGTTAQAGRVLWGSHTTQSNGAFGGASFNEPGQHGGYGRTPVRER